MYEGNLFGIKDGGLLSDQGKNNDPPSYNLVNDPS